PETAQDQERRIRREIANSNERRRMQSINAGFQSLKTLLPHTDGEKLSKEFSGSSPKRRRAEEKDEGIGSPDALEEEKVEELRREMIELRQQLDKERSARMQLEEQVISAVRSLDGQLQPERLKVITQQVEEEQALIQSQTLLRLQQIHAAAADRQAHSPQVGNTLSSKGSVLQIAQKIGENMSPCLKSCDKQDLGFGFILVFCLPGAGSTCPNPPPHGHRPSSNTKPAPSRHRGDHEPTCPHQHRFHLQTEPGHHCAGLSLF
ncbi:Transcription factor AP-4, partial [Goodea atripinnis]